MRFIIPLFALMAGLTLTTIARADDEARPDGSAARPLRVVLIPADGGTEDGTKADFQPIFSAIQRTYGLHFTIRVGQSYGAVVEGMVNDKVDVAFFGPLSFYQAKQKRAAELLAVAVTGGQSSYFSGIFVRRDSGIKTLADIKGKSIALGDINSASSFNFPLAMLIDGGIDPIRDLGKVYITGSHANALAALTAGRADAAGASFDSFEKAVANKQIDPSKFMVLIKSDPIPYPPIAMHTKLDPALKKKLRDAFNNVHKAPDIKPEMIRGYGGKRVDRYDADYSVTEFDKAIGKLVKVNDELIAELLKKAAN